MVVAADDEVLRAAGATVTFSSPAVVVAAAAVPTAVLMAAEAAVAAAMAAADAEAGAPVAAGTTVVVALRTGDVADVDAAAAVDSNEATTAGDTSVSSGGLGGGVAKPDQHVDDGELPLDVTLLAQSSPTSTSTRVAHVVNHGDSERVGDEETIGSSFR